MPENGLLFLTLADAVSSRNLLVDAGVALIKNPYRESCRDLTARIRAHNQKYKDSNPRAELVEISTEIASDIDKAYEVKRLIDAVANATTIKQQPSLAVAV